MINESKALAIKLQQKVENLLKDNSLNKDAQHSEIELLKLIYKLEVHQSELEMQNEELLTAKKRAEELATEKYAELYDSAPNGYFTLTKEAKIIDLNLSGANMLGNERTELKHSAFVFFVSDATKPIFKKFLDKTFKGKSKQTCELTLTINGQPVYVLITGIVTDKGLHCLLSVVDVTEHIQVKNALHESNEQYRLHFENSGEAILFTQPDGTICSANPEACRVFCRTEEEIKKLGRGGLCDLTDPRLVAAIEVRSKTGHFKGELNLLRRDGTSFPMEISTTIYKDSSGAQRTSMFARDISERKKAEAALDKNNATLTLAMQVAKMAWWEMDIVSGNITFEKRKAEMLGYKPEDFKHYKDFMVLVHPEDAERAMDAMRRHIYGTADKYEVEYRILAKSGEYHWFYDIGSATKRDSNGKPTLVTGLVTNITERKRAEEEILIKNTRLKLAMQSGKMVWWEMDIPTGNVIFDKGKVEMLGYQPEEFTNYRDFMALVHPQDNESCMTAMRDHYQGRAERYEVEYRILTKSGEYLWCSDIGSISRRDEHGKPLSITGLAFDINERKQAEQKIKESEERRLAILQTAMDGYWLLDMQGRVLEVNETYCSMSGYSKQELLNMHISDLENIETKNDIAARIQTIVEQGESRFEACHRRKDGSIFEIEASVQFQPAEGGQFVVFMHDITVRKQAENALRESEEKVRIKLQSILSPEGSIADLELSDIIDVPSIQKLMDNFYELSQVPMAIIDTNGKVLVGSGWQDICTKFHRVHPESCRNCLQSDVHLTQGIRDGEFKLYKCNNHMWDIATPLLIGGEHKGNLFMGQFFFDSEPLDITLFRKQAVRYGFDEQQYIDALERAPRISRQKLDQAKAFFLTLSRSISQLSYSNIKLARVITQQKKIEDALRESEKLLNKSQEIAHLGSWSLDLITNRLMWSDEIYRMFGLQPQEFSATYEGFLNAIHPEDREAVNAAYTNSILHDKDSYEIEHRIIGTHSGEHGHVLEKCEHIRDAAGKIVGSVGMMYDITERKHNIEALKQLNEELEDRVKERTDELMTLNADLQKAEIKYRTVADFTYNWEFWIDQNNVLLYCSPACERITGYKASAYIQNPRLLFDIIHPEDMIVYRDHKLNENHAQEGRQEIEYRIIRNDGAVRWIGHACQPLFDESGNYTGSRGSNKDITARKKMQEMIVTSNQKYKLLSENISDGIIMCRNGHFEYVNQAMNQMLGYDDLELEGVRLTQLAMPHCQEELENFLTVNRPINQTQNIEVEFTKKDSSTVFVDILFNYVAKENVVYGVVHDVTEKKEIQKNIVKAIIQTEEKERAHFSKELHDGLGPLLSTIKLYLQWSLRPKSINTRDEIIGKAEEILEEALITVKEISVKLSPHLLTNYGLTLSIESFVRKLQDTCVIHIIFESNTSRRFDPDIEASIYRAIIECINNTIKYANANNIHILLNDTGSQLLLEYKDDGIGFDFSTTLCEHKGLGLFNLQNRITSIGGKITLASTPGEGVHYHITVDI